MRIPRVYVPTPLVENKNCSLPPETVNYLGVVLRIAVGHKVKLFNENDGEFLSTVIFREKRKIEVQVEKKVSPQRN
jgi:16S rRNA U1498 N3-methylase RsmE